MRFFSLFIILFGAFGLCAQSNNTSTNWIGVHNLFFKNKDVEFDPVPLLPDSIAFQHGGSIDKQFSIGFFFRKVYNNGWYQQFDLFELNWGRNRQYSQVRWPQITEPSRGSEVKDFNVLLGYQRGKLFSISQKFSGDIGLRGTAWYKKNHNVPLTSAGYPVRTTSVGLGLNLEVGLNFQLHERINIGYNITPVTALVFWNESDHESPILTIDQRKETSVNFDTNFFDSVLGLRNFHISYVF